MKEELIGVLNNKLKSVNLDIEALTKLNDKIALEQSDLSYVKGILDLFRDGEGYNVLNFVKLSSDDFTKILSITNDLGEMFNTSSCNYDGLIYLINGINNGISLSLTLEQENAINYLIQSVEGVSYNHEGTIDGLLLAKSQFKIDDVNVLNEQRNIYENIIDNLNNDKYVTDLDYVEEAIAFDNLDTTKTIDILKYLLKYNADIYQSGSKYETKFDEVSNINYNDFVVPNEDIKENEEISFDDHNDNDFHLPEFNNIEDEMKEDITYKPTDKEIEEIISNQLNNNESEYSDKEIKINEDLSDISNDKDYEEYNIPSVDETISISPVVEATSTREVQRLFAEYNVSFSDSELNELTVGNIDSYREVLSLLKENGLLGEFVKNKDLFKNALLNSDSEVINEVLKIVKNELSVDEDDYHITLQIAINTIPSIFVKENGNYDNFVSNIQTFKELGINLVNLFDFSKEVLIVDHDTILNNYSIVKNYNINLDYHNVKYMLVLPNINEKIDYYVESVYPDRTKNNEKFDGITYINNYPNKLNNVSSETIKRLRYSSENSKKVFGSKPNSLAGEITNLKVNVLNIPADYLDSFFNNDFDVITLDEVREYTKLCQNSSNISNFTDELASLEEFHNGLRYTINGINISYNKVIHNYNTLRSYGIGKRKALLFAVCYNLVITKEEYDKLKELLEERDGE